MTINERFKSMINELYSGNKRSFAITIGVNPTVIENIVGKRGGNPSYEVIEKVVFSNANISPEWLLTGNGSMLRNEKSTDQIIPVVDNTSMGFILDRYDNLVAENALLKKKVEELESSRGKSTHTPTYTISEAKIGTHIAAEPAPK